MRGSHHIIVQNNKVRYEFDIKRNITIIRGDSATGKTQLISMLESYQRDGISSGIEIQSDCELAVIYANNWESEIDRLQGAIVFIEEGQGFVATNDFAEKVRGSDAYFVIITRQVLDNLPYSVEEIYGIRSSRKYKGLRQIYNEFYRLYGDQYNNRWEIERVLTEDSNSGFEFFNNATRSGLTCESAHGKSNVHRILRGSADAGLLIIADGAAFGPQMEAVMRLIDEGKKVLLYLPESFEWLILSSEIIEDSDIQGILNHPEDHIDSRDYFSWERFFSALLSDKTDGTYLKYVKAKLNPAYLQDKERQLIINELPEAIRGYFV